MIETLEHRYAITPHPQKLAFPQDHSPDSLKAFTETLEAELNARDPAVRGFMYQLKTVQEHMRSIRHAHHRRVEQPRLIDSLRETLSGRPSGPEAMDQEPRSVDSAFRSGDETPLEGAVLTHKEQDADRKEHAKRDDKTRSITQIPYTLFTHPKNESVTNGQSSAAPPPDIGYGK